MRITTLRNATAPRLFASVRGSRDLSLVAFGGALLTAFALQMGAFIPRAGSPESHLAVQAAAQANGSAAVVAAPAPCALPRG